MSENTALGVATEKITSCTPYWEDRIDVKNQIALQTAEVKVCLQKIKEANGKCSNSLV